MLDKHPVRFAEIRLPSDPPFSSYSVSNTRGLGPLSLVNIFVGANNSGKSRLLRALFSLKEVQYTTDDYSADADYDLIKEAKAKLDAIFSRNSLTRIGAITSAHFREVLNLDSHFVVPAVPIHGLAKSKLKALQAVTEDNMTFSRAGAPDAGAIVGEIKALGRKLLDEFNKHKSDAQIEFKRRYYIPILRGMRPLDDDQTNRYRDRTVKDYFSNDKQKIRDETVVFTGIELYETLKRKLLGEPEDREAVKHFEEFLSTRFFNSHQITLIPYEGDTTVRLKIGSEKQLPIYELGDGMQSLLISLFNIFMESDRCLFFIEEPDVCMHPSLQRSFLEVISGFEQHQYFITTHSNHFLDMTLDFSNISVFHFSKIVGDKASFQIRVASSRDHNLLRDLGVRNSSVFLTNATIWVEGITDRLYLRAYMAKYCLELKDTKPESAKALSNLKEDLHYSFVEYQGANLTHWGFDPEDDDAKRMKATQVCAHAFLIADGDIATKGDRKETYQAMLDDRFLILKAKEIENSIPPEVLKCVVADEFKKQGKDVELIKFEDYSKKEIGLGTYLDKLLGKAIFATDSGTIKSKVSFCEKATEIMRDQSVAWTLPTELSELCRRVFDHILKENQEQGVVNAQPAA